MGAVKTGKADNHQGSLTIRQYRAIALLLAGNTDKEVRAKLGIPSQTMAKWWRKRAFRETYESRARVLLDSAMTYSKNHLKEAVDVLRENLHAPKDADRIRAAMGLIQVVFKAHEVTEIAVVFARMEQFQREFEALYRKGGSLYDEGREAGLESRTLGQTRKIPG